MAQKTPEELSEALSFFPPGSSKTVQRLLKRAAEDQAREARRGSKSNHLDRSGAEGGNAIVSGLARDLTKAMRQRGATKREQPSVKQKSPKSGGRPFHFAFSVVKKAASAPSGKTKSGAGGSTKAAAHMGYIERELAVEGVTASTVIPARIALSSTRAAASASHHPTP